MSNPNKKKINLPTGVWVSLPENICITSQQEKYIEEIVNMTIKLLGEHVHAVHLNEDREDKEKIHSLNIVMKK